MVLLDIGANPDSTAGEPRPVRPDGRDLRRARPRRRASRASRCCRSARRRARATPGSSAATELLDATDLRFVGNVEGKDLTPHLADVVVCDAVLGNVVIKFFEGLSTFIFDLWRAEFRRAPAGPPGVPAAAPGHRPDPRRLRLREGRRLAAARRPRDGHHHPRPGEAADDRLRLRGRRDDGPDAASRS